MVHIWIRSETFQHAFLVPPIAAWLIWRKRAEVASVALQPVLWLLLPMAAICFMWLLGDLADVAAASQLALVTLGVLSVPALYGWRLARVLAFPLLFLFFMVPIGEFAVPYLQAWTADVTVVALRLTGVPVYREGMQFVIPSGTWSVVEACSGIRYIIACFMVGTLFAYLNYRSTRRRAIFVVVALLVPVAANWIRAYTIVMIGHVTGSPMILGVEHTTYGWFLFGAVVMVMFWVGSFWSEDAPVATLTGGHPHNTSPQPVMGVPPMAPLVAGIAALLMAVQFWSWSLQPGGPDTVPEVMLPDQVGEWRAAGDLSQLDWQPGFLNPSSTRVVGYRNGGATVQLWVGYYHQQSAERKLVTSMHRVVSTEGKTWRGQSTGIRHATRLPAFATTIASPGAAPTLTAMERQRVWHVYWLDGRWLIRPPEIKLRQAFSRLLGRSDDGAIVMLVTPMRDDADAIMEKFARENLPAVGAALETTRKSLVSMAH
jgi:exosortase A